MSVALYTDVHVPRAIVDQLRRRGVDVLSAWEDGTTTLSDEALLAHVHTLGRVIFTQDIRFRALGEAWQREGREFSGLAFGHQLYGTIGEYVADLELIAVASSAADWRNVVVYLPLSRQRMR